MIKCCRVSWPTSIGIEILSTNLAELPSSMVVVHILADSCPTLLVAVVESVRESDRERERLEVAPGSIYDIQEYLHVTSWIRFPLPIHSHRKYQYDLYTIDYHSNLVMIHIMIIILSHRVYVCATPSL